MGDRDGRLMVYAICFDFPENPDPWFATQLRDGLGWTTSLPDALRFGSEAEAERLIESGYGQLTGRYATVVEIGT